MARPHFEIFARRLGNEAIPIYLLRTFVKLRQILTSNCELARRLDELEGKYDQQFKVVFDAIRLLMNPRPSKKKEIGFRPKLSKK